MIVVDVGCARYGGDYSLERLIEEFKPRLVYGFDPSNEIVATAGDTWSRMSPEKLHYVTPAGVIVILEQKAAWTFDGEVPFLFDTLGGCITGRSDQAKVECFELARFIKELPDEDELVLKMDCEGSEYEVLEHLMSKGVDERISFLWIEWHDFGVLDPTERRKSIERRLRCQMDEWRW